MLLTNAYCGKTFSPMNHNILMLNRIFDVFGISTYSTKNQNYIKKAKEYLEVKSISETAVSCGFKNRYHFSKVFKRITGSIPKQYKLT